MIDFKNNKHIWSIAIGTIVVSAVALAASFTLSGYSRSVKILGVNGSELRVGAEGVRKTQVTLNMNNIWTVTENSNPVATIWALVWLHGETPPFVWQQGTVSDNNSNYYNFSFELSSLPRNCEVAVVR